MLHRLLIIVFVLFLCLPSYEQTAPAIYFPFNGNTNDASGNNQNGINHGATLTNDRNNQANSAYHFDGNSYIEFPTQILDCPKYTICLWAQVDYNQTDIAYGRYILDIGSYQNTVGVEQYPPPNQNEMKMGSFWEHTGGGTGFSNRYSYNQNEWYFVSITVDSTTKSVHEYINGASGAALLMSMPGFFRLNTKAGRIGCYYDNTSFFKGNIDDIRIYCDTLSRSEIQNLYCSIQAPLSMTDTICAGESASFNVYNGNFTYNWFDSSTSNSSINSGANYTTGILYQTDTFYVQSNNAICSSAKIPVVAVVKNNVIQITSAAINSAACEFDSVAFSVSTMGNINSYQWQVLNNNFQNLVTADSLLVNDSIIEFQPVGSNFTNKYFRVIITGVCAVADTSDLFYLSLKNNCSTPIDTSVVIPPIAPKKTLSFTNIITLNNDGSNDVFFINNIDVSSTNNLHIYNRWGNEIYNTNNYKNDWPQSNTEINSGTYYYIFTSESKVYKGYISIIK